jgi:hypothetical protein
MLHLFRKVSDCGLHVDLVLRGVVPHRLPEVVCGRKQARTVETNNVGRGSALVEAGVDRAQY